MGACCTKDSNYEKNIERQRLIGCNYSKLVESALTNGVDLTPKHMYKEAMDSKYEYLLVDINKYKCVSISVCNGTYTIDMNWKVIKGKLILLSMSYDTGYVLDGDRLRELISQKITLDDLLDAYFEYIDGHVKSVKDFVKVRTIKAHK